MRVLCVGRHAFLSEHLCRVFGTVGALCEPVVGSADVPRAAARFEPELIVSDGDLLTPAVLEGWAHEPALRDVPVLAVTLTPRADDALPIGPHSGDYATAVYLPALDRSQLAGLLDTLHRPRGVIAPPDWHVHTEPASLPQL